MSIVCNAGQVTEETEGLRFNTGIAAMMEFVNGAYKWEQRPKVALEQFTLLLAPYAPHLAEEMWQVPCSALPCFAHLAVPLQALHRQRPYLLMSDCFPACLCSDPACRRSELTQHREQVASAVAWEVLQMH